MTDHDLHALFQRQLVRGPDGRDRIMLYPGEGEFVCARCDTIQVATGKPAHCSCGSDRIETLTAIRPEPFGATARG